MAWWPTNQRVADLLREAAGVLAEREDNPFRVRAYRRAADVVVSLSEDVGELARREGARGLVALPGIGVGLAAAIDEIVRTGRWSQLDRLRRAVGPERLFKVLPGIGPVLAHRIHATLEVETLEALEAAAHDGRLAAVPGVGARRATMLRAELAALLGRTRASREAPAEEPPVALLLDVDAEYRAKAAARRLRTIAPRRFNPTGEAWLPVLRTERGAWRFTALFSNTAQAHRLGRTRDWVVIYFHTGTRREGQRTVVTETQGPLAGRRVVRGLEATCLALARARHSVAVAGR